MAFNVLCILYILNKKRYRQFKIKKNVSSSHSKTEISRAIIIETLILSNSKPQPDIVYLRGALPHYATDQCLYAVAW